MDNSSYRFFLKIIVILSNDISEIFLATNFCYVQKLIKYNFEPVNKSVKVDLTSDVRLIVENSH